ncbi:hypothetical protein V8G54_031781, partial [Vigna mungo]
VSPTNNINTSSYISFTYISYIFICRSFKNELAYFSKYIQPTQILLPIIILEDFTKPSFLNFQLFKNMLTDELIVVVLVSLVPIIIFTPVGLFTNIMSTFLLF